MPIPDPETIASWSPSQLAKYVQQILFDPQSLPSAMSLDALSVLGDLEVGGNALVNGIVKGFGGVATTVGPEFPVNPTPGQIHFLQIDVAPFIHELMVFDGNLNQWISVVPVTWAAPAANTTPGANWSATGDNTVVRGHVRHAKKFYDKGLRPQTFLAGRFDFTGGSGSGSLRVTMYQFNDGDTALARILSTDSNATTGAADIAIGAGVGNVLKVTNWSDRVLLSGASVDDDHWQVVLEQRTNAASGDIAYAGLEIGFRWVST